VGSYLTPFGNPHNLYIYNLGDYYGFTFIEYECALIPIVAVGAITLLALSMLIKNEPLDVELGKEIELEDKKVLAVIIALFILAIITVVDIIPFYITLVIIVVAFIFMMPSVFRKVNYSILFIFFFLFLFANGLTNMEAVYQVISDLMSWDPMLTTVMTSQVTSNVPSTILLQPFTNDWAAVLVGADIGGFGTPIASMASIISLKLYYEEEDASLKKYLKIFFAVNIVMLLVLIPTYYIFD
jgi:Na+/H+ antiporter NhaD/arsenite permease-like protein